MNIVSIYAAVLGIFFVFLSVRTLRWRRKLRIGIGDSGNPEMLRAIRVHSNVAEYVPLTLVLAFFLRAQGAAAPVVHGVCRHPEDYRFRVGGMPLTFSGILGATGLLLLRQLS